MKQIAAALHLGAGLFGDLDGRHHSVPGDVGRRTNKFVAGLVEVSVRPTKEKRSAAVQRCQALWANIIDEVAEVFFHRLGQSRFVVGGAMGLDAVVLQIEDRVRR